MFEDAKKLHEYLPILYSLGVAAILPVVPPSYTMSDEMQEILVTRGDKREGQLLYQFDNVIKALKEKIVEYGLETPLALLGDGIDRTALIFFNKNQEVLIAKLKFNFNLVER